MSTLPLVLVADDEQRITKLVSMALTGEGFRVVTAAGGEEALAKAEEVRPDIILLDIVMPDLDGIEVMRQIRERRSVPVILLTARGAASDKAKGLDQGADDYIAKPFHLDELAARVRAVLRRASGVSTGIGAVRFDDVEIDLERRIVTRGGEIVELSRTEWLLLQHLAANAGKVVLHTELLTKVWGPEYRDDLQYLRVWVSRVRRKLGARPGEPGRIKTFQGIGYLLDVEPGRLEESHDDNRSHGTAPAPAAAPAPATLPESARAKAAGEASQDQVRHDVSRQNSKARG
jgi:two-component system KDP operon response regulator KdpE